MRALVGLLWVIGSGCVHPIQAALTRPEEPVVVVFEEREAVLGAVQTRIENDGSFVRRRWRPDFFTSEGHPESALGSNAPPLDPDGADVVESGQLTPDDRRALETLIVELEGWEQEVDDDPSRLERSRARLVLEASGERSVVWEWANDLQSLGRLSRLKSFVDEAVSRRAEPASGARE